MKRKVLGETETYQVGLNIGCMNSIFAAQKLSNWCWAATTEMILKSQCVESITQKSLVDGIFSKLDDCYPDCSSNLDKVKDALDKYQVTDTNSDNKIIKVSTSIIFPKTSVMIKELEEERPFIIGLNQGKDIDGHAYVVTNLIYSIDNFGFEKIESFTLLDPDPSTENTDNNGVKLSNFEFIKNNFNSCLMLKLE